MTIDERIEGLTQSVELLAKMHEKTAEEISHLVAETRRFQYWAEAIILNYEARLRALAKEPPAQPPE
jgi:hypothetical protein